jgi:hypothetical protein
MVRLSGGRTGSACKFARGLRTGRNRRITVAAAKKSREDCQLPVKISQSVIHQDSCSGPGANETRMTLYRCSSPLVEKFRNVMCPLGTRANATHIAVTMHGQSISRPDNRRRTPPHVTSHAHAPAIAGPARFRRRRARRRRRGSDCVYCPLENSFAIENKQAEALDEETLGRNAYRV